MVCARCQALQDEVDVLRRALGQEINLPAEFGLTRTEECLLKALMAREQLSHDQIMDVVYAATHNEPSPHMTRVWAFKVKTKLKPFGLNVETIWGRGYRLPPAHKAKIAAMVQSELRAASV